MKQIDSAIKDKKLFLLDIDGTIAFDNTLFEGAIEFLQQVLEQNGMYIFITNNSTKSRMDYIQKFKNWNIPVNENNFLTASYVTALYLKEHYKDKLLFVLGTKSFVEELRSFGLKVTERIENQLEQIAVAVVGFDNELNYQKVAQICELLQTKEVDYVATNPDLVCPVGFGFVPDCGAICEFIEKAVHRMPIFIGKPSRFIVDLARENTGYTKEETIVIGDRLYTDIACGINGEVETLVVFTGEAKQGDLENTKFKPTFYSDTILQVYKTMIE